MRDRVRLSVRVSGSVTVYSVVYSIHGKFHIIVNTAELRKLQTQNLQCNCVHVHRRLYETTECGL